MFELIVFKIVVSFTTLQAHFGPNATTFRRTYISTPTLIDSIITNKPTFTLNTPTNHFDPPILPHIHSNIGFKFEALSPPADNCARIPNDSSNHSVVWWCLGAQDWSLEIIIWRKHIPYSHRQCPKYYGHSFTHFHVYQTGKLRRQNAPNWARCQDDACLCCRWLARRNCVRNAVYCESCLFEWLSTTQHTRRRWLHNKQLCGKRLWKIFSSYYYWFWAHTHTPPHPHTPEVHSNSWTNRAEKLLWRAV